MLRKIVLKDSQTKTKIEIKPRINTGFDLLNFDINVKSFHF